MEYAQILVDSGISANWVIAGMLIIIIAFQKRANDKADKRESKVDSILEGLEKMINSHESRLDVIDAKMEKGFEVHITKRT